MLFRSHYDYRDKTITQCYEIGYPCTNPGNLTLEEQANYFIRHMLHSLVWQIPLIRMGSITDMGNSYYHSNWGASGICFAKPDISPKPSYVAVATMTSQLDGAKFTRLVPTGSASVYAVEFERPDNRFVTAMWTLRGTQAIKAAEEFIDPLEGLVEKATANPGAPFQPAPQKGIQAS